jgi:hypothetical protein
VSPAWQAQLHNPKPTLSHHKLKISLHISASSRVSLQRELLDETMQASRDASPATQKGFHKT